MLSLLRKYLASRRRAMRDRLLYAVHEQLLPTRPLHDDTYLVAFPKSGVTWLSFILSNVNLKMSGSPRELNFFNVEDFIPDIHQARNLKEEILSFPGHRLIKSHSGYNPWYRKVIYLVRDPRDVLVSYYWFNRKLGAFNGTLSEMIRAQFYGIDAWCAHVEGWLSRIEPSQQFGFLNYEDLKADPKREIQRVYALLGAPVPDAILDECIALSSFEKMKKLEEQSTAGIKLRFPGFEFVRKGQAGGHKSEMTDADREYIAARAEKWMKMFGYA